MIPAFHHEQSVKVGEDVLRLVMNFDAIAATEAASGRTYDTILADFTGGAASPPVALQAQVVQGLLRQHQPEMTIDQAMTLVRGAAGASLGVALGALFVAAFPEAAAGSAGAHPRKPRGTSKPSSSRGAGSV